MVSADLVEKPVRRAQVAQFLPCFRKHRPSILVHEKPDTPALLRTSTVFAQTEKPLTSFPYTPGLDLYSMDKTADPCVDFYQYSCGGWKKKNPIPGDQARWSVYGKLYQDNQQFLWGILDQLSQQAKGATPTSKRSATTSAPAWMNPLSTSSAPSR